MSDLDDIEFKIARLELGPDDILVIRCKDILSTTQTTRFRETLRDGLGIRKCFILENGADLGVLSPAPIDEVLAGKTDDELNTMFERGEISRNEMRRAQGLRQFAYPAEKPAAA